MRSRAFGVLAAVVLLASAPAGAAAAEQWTDAATMRVAVESSQAGSLLAVDQLTAGGMGQWIWPGVVGGPYGGFALPQTAAFFGYTNSFNPVYNAGLLGSTGSFSTNQLSAFNTLSALNQTGLAPASALSLGSLTGLGLATTATSPLGVTNFGIGGLNFPLALGQNVGNTSLGQFPGFPGVFQPTFGFNTLNPFLSQAGVGLSFVR